MALAPVTLDDKYLKDGRVFLTGSQALVRLALMQRRRDAAAGLNTAGYVSGYRGSPLGGVDKEFWRAGDIVRAHAITFKPGVNEDLAATAVWGTQQLGLFDGAKVDGVFAMWYGKGPGVDRSGDVFRHANMAGTAPLGGVLAIAGDDPACKSSTVPSQSEYAFIDAQMPILYPANVQELIDFGLIGWAMSRHSGLWVGLKAITETMDSSAAVSVEPERPQIRIPDAPAAPDGGLHIRWPDQPLEQERRLQRHKLYAALAFARANGIDRTVIDSPNPRLGIITAGKSYLDVMQALDDLGIDPAYAAEIGLRVYKVGMPWPLERDGVRAFADGLEEILVVEEKRAVMENQLKEQLYNWREDVRPRVVGKFDEAGEWLLPSYSELTPAAIARVIAARLERFVTSKRITGRLKFLAEKETDLARDVRPDFKRIPYFCAGCPHNTSTRVPDGSVAAAGIGCHYMVTWMDRDTTTFTHMGGEGANWNGIAPFTDTNHLFVNLGDGTYYHSGLLAIRAAVAAGVNVTYKVLYNDAVAMTGGQPVDGPLDCAMITRQLAAEGVSRIAVVADDPEKYPSGTRFADAVTLHHRRDLDAVQRELRQVTGVSALLFDQTCAAELRRRRKRGQAPDPSRRAFINAAVCEGCGDCGVKSNCVAIAPLETAFGRKRAIDQSACNKDLSCLDGFCPSLVTVEGGRLRKNAPAAPDAVPDAPLPEPARPAVERSYDIVVTGIGGSGVVTVGALLGMAAHLEGQAVSVLDQIGLAQKNGAVMSHVRIGAGDEAIYSQRIPAGGAHLLIGCDLVTAGGFEALSKLHDVHSRAVIDSHHTMTAAFTQDPNLDFPAADLHQAIAKTTLSAEFIDASALARALFSDTMAANVMMIGYACQKGLLPVSHEAIEGAIAITAVAVEGNHWAFYWGRLAAHDPARATAAIAAGPGAEAPAEAPPTLEALIRHRAEHLKAYSGAALARRFEARIERLRQAEIERAPGRDGLAAAAASGYAKLLAAKDPYEVARLFAGADFKADLDRTFEGDWRLKFHLSPPFVAPHDPASGAPLKITFGPWMMGAFRILAALKGLRDTPFDIFRLTPERRLDRRLIALYEKTLDTLTDGLGPDNHARAVAIAGLAEGIRGYGPIRAAAAAEAEETLRRLLKDFS